MRWGGLTEDEALALVTINPAKQLRIDNRVGSLEVGKDADVVVWNHHPLSTYAIADRVYIDGTVYYDRIAEDARLTALKKEKSDLAAAEAAAQPRRDGHRRTAGESAAEGGSRDECLPESAVQSGNSRKTRPPAPAARPPASGPVWAITNATIHPDHDADDRTRHDRDPRQQDRGDRRERHGAARREDRRRGGRRRLSGLHQRANDDGTERTRRRAASKTSTRCSTSTRSCARASRITPRATRSR